MSQPIPYKTIERYENNLEYRRSLRQEEEDDEEENE